MNYIQNRKTKIIDSEDVNYKSKKSNDGQQVHKEVIQDHSFNLALPFSFSVKRKNSKPAIEPIPDDSSQEGIAMAFCNRSASLEQGIPSEKNAYETHF